MDYVFFINSVSRTVILFRFYIINLLIIIINIIIRLTATHITVPSAFILENTIFKIFVFNPIVANNTQKKF